MQDADAKRRSVPSPTIVKRVVLCTRHYYVASEGKYNNYFGMMSETFEKRYGGHK